MMFGSPETTPGGRALKFFASVRVETGGPPRSRTVRRRWARVQAGDDQEEQGGPAVPQSDIEIYFNKGISYVADMLGAGGGAWGGDALGNWYVFGDTKLGNGKAKTIETLEDAAMRRCSSRWMRRSRPSCSASRVRRWLAVAAVMREAGRMRMRRKGREGRP